MSILTRRLHTSTRPWSYLNDKPSRRRATRIDEQYRYEPRLTHHGPVHNDYPKRDLSFRSDGTERDSSFAEQHDEPIRHWTHHNRTTTYVTTAPLISTNLLVPNRHATSPSTRLATTHRLSTKRPHMSRRVSATPNCSQRQTKSQLVPPTLTHTKRID